MFLKHVSIKKYNYYTLFSAYSDQQYKSNSQNNINTELTIQSIELLKISKCN